jgi:antitoxin (DNA-binding transcriptional repressor) of toxin-antitoxin stability system
MKTLTVTQARKNLSSWLRRAKAGEEIGIVDGADIITLRPVVIRAVDYVVAEYGLTVAEADVASSRIVAEAAAERTKGNIMPLAAVSTYAESRAHAARRRGSKKPRA